MARGDKSAQVRAGAKRIGRSERTVWRWLKAADDPDVDVDDVVDAAEERVCRNCREPLPPEVTARKEYCDDVCRQYARRRRIASASFNAARATRTNRDTP